MKTQEEVDIDSMWALDAATDRFSHASCPACRTMPDGRWKMLCGRVLYASKVTRPQTTWKAEVNCVECARAGGCPTCGLTA